MNIFRHILYKINFHCVFEYLNFVENVLKVSIFPQCTLYCGILQGVNVPRTSCLIGTVVAFLQWGGRWRGKAGGLECQDILSGVGPLTLLSIGLLMRYIS